MQSKTNMLWVIIAVTGTITGVITEIVGANVGGNSVEVMDL